MNARYHAPVYQAGEAQGELRYRLENASDLPWAPDSDLRISYQIFDFPSGALMVEGERLILPAVVAPGAPIDVRLPVQLPTESGEYRIYSSLMIEGEAWSYERGFPFVSAELTIGADRKSRVGKLAVTSLAQIRRAGRLRALPFFFFLPFRTVWRNRRLSYSLTKREILSRSRGSFGGALWTVLSPLLLMATYFFVFGLVLKSRFENDPSPASFALYFLAGMLPWLAFSEAAGRAPGLLVEYRQLIRKLVFPIEVLPVNLVLSGLVGEAFGLGLFILALTLIRAHLPWTVVYLPAVLLPQLLFTVAVCWFMSALGAFLRDLAQVNGFLLTLLFFVTPICYPENQVPAGARWLLTKNPIYILVKGYRAIFLQTKAPDWKSLGVLTVVSVLLAVGAHTWFFKLKKHFADIL